MWTEPFSPSFFTGFPVFRQDPLDIMGILATPPKATPPQNQGLIKGLLPIGFP